MNVNRSWQEGLALILAAAFLGTGCQQADPQLPPEIPTVQRAGSQESGGEGRSGEQDRGGDSGTNAGRWLDFPDLQALQPALSGAANRAGFCAGWIQPDASCDRSFLVVAPDPAAARQLNGFFYWLSDRTAAAGEPNLILCLDRLFPESSRSFVFAGGLYSDQAVVSLLEFSLNQVLGDRYEPGILAFILGCYRKHFEQRLNSPDLPVWTLHKTFQRIEVTYDASLYNSVCFSAGS